MLAVSFNLYVVDWPMHPAKKRDSLISFSWPRKSSSNSFLKDKEMKAVTFQPFNSR